MIARYQLPVYSPVSLGALAAGTRALVLAGDAQGSLAKKLCVEFAADTAVLTDSGTSALALALAAASQARDNRPVALPAYSCWDLASAAIAASVPVVLYDLDPHTLAPDPLSFSRALQHGVSSVVLVHLYGIPIDAGAVHAQVRGAGALLIEDAAQAFGARFGGERAGVLGDYTVLSFGRGKGLSGGGGGALLARGSAATSPAAPRERVSGMRALTVLAAQWLLGRPSLYSLPAALPALRLGETVYHAPHAAAGASSVSARAVLRNWVVAETEARLRAERAALLLDAGNACERIQWLPQATPSFLRLPLLGRSHMLQGAGAVGARRLGIMPGYPAALSALPQLQPWLQGRTQSFDGAEELAARLITLPVHARLTAIDLNRIAHWLMDAERSAPSARAVAVSALTRSTATTLS